MRTRTWILLLVLGALWGCDDDATTPVPEPRFYSTTARLLSTGNPTKDEDPSILRAGDGSMFVAWFSDRDGPGDIYLARNEGGDAWSSARRVTFDPGGDFYPSLLQDAGGVFHLTWFRWYALERGHILHSTSSDGLSWNVADEESVTTDLDVDDWVPTPSLASDGTLFVYFVSERRGGNGTSDLYVASKASAPASWTAPDSLSILSSATEHDHLPFVARTGSGFTMVWVRHDTSVPLPWNNPKSHVFLSTSADGTTWSAPQQVTTDAGNVVNLFPFIVDGTTLVWLSTRGGPPKVYEMPLAMALNYPSGVTEVTSLPPGYSHRMAPTSTGGIYLGAWVQGPLGAEDVYYRFFER